MDKQQQDKTRWKEVIGRSDEASTRKAKEDPDAPILHKTRYQKPAKKNHSQNN